MGATTGIAWTDATWNPVRGCSRVSEGCRNCYAQRMAARFAGPGMAYEGLAKQTLDGPRWTGKVRLVEEHLEDPLRWKKPRRVFVNSMSDLFHESIPDETIARVFAVMALAEKHTFQVLTKRPERMRALLSEHQVKGDHPGSVAFLHLVGRLCEEYAVNVEKQSAGAMMGFDAWWGLVEDRGFLPNVWLGVSVENQPTAIGRIPTLLNTPAAVRFVSAEPLLGPVALRDDEFDIEWLQAQAWQGKTRPLIDWVIVGGESGPGARPCNLDWIADLVRQCGDARVACFVKQLGAQPRVTEGPACDKWCGVGLALDDCGGVHFKDPKGANPAEWPEHLRVQEWPTSR